MTTLHSKNVPRRFAVLKWLTMSRSGTSGVTISAVIIAAIDTGRAPPLRMIPTRRSGERCLACGTEVGGQGTPDPLQVEGVGWGDDPLLARAVTRHRRNEGAYGSGLRGGEGEVG